MPSLPKRRRLNDDNAPAAAAEGEAPAPPAAVADTEMTAAAAPTSHEGFGNGVAGGDGGSPAAKRRRRYPYFRSKFGGNKGGGGGSGRCPCFSRQRNPLQVLNEFRRGIAFNMTAMDGPSHAPTITMAADVEGQHFEAQATSKQRAKMMVGAQIVAFFEQGGQLRLVDGDVTPAGDAAAPVEQQQPQQQEEPNQQYQQPNQQEQQQHQFQHQQQRPQGQGPAWNAGQKTPLMRLYELMPSRPSCDTWEDKEQKTFVASFSINGRCFQVELLLPPSPVAPLLFPEDLEKLNVGQQRICSV